MNFKVETLVLVAVWENPFIFPIDDIAMQAMMDKIKPLLNKELALPEEEHIGFAVAMDFAPQEEMGHWATQTLFNNLETQK